IRPLRLNGFESDIERSACQRLRISSADAERQSPALFSAAIARISDAIGGRVPKRHRHAKSSQRRRRRADASRLAFREHGRDRGVRYACPVEICRIRTKREVSGVLNQTKGGNPVWAVRPPSTTSVVPVTNEASSEARKSTALAISSGSPIRPIGF